MRIGSLFSGIGGLELGLERAIPGAQVVWQVERDPYARRVLAKHWPSARRYEDVKEVGAHNLGVVDLICGGFPCQGTSNSGKRKGLKDERAGLWFQFERIADELNPRWIVIENVHHTWRRWVPVVRRRLHAIGYASVPLRLSAADVGAWHRRRRVFILAHANGSLLRQLPGWWTGAQGQVAEELIRPIRWPPCAEPSRVDDGIPYRVDRNRCLGNAIVPQVAEVVGRVVAELERLR